MHVITHLGEYRVKHIGPHVMVLHDEELPALIRGNFCAYYQEGRRHREGAPAVFYPDGKIAHYINGELHNEHGAAVEWPSGAKLYAIKGKWHRTDGPALITHTGMCFWFVNGKRMTKEAFDAKFS